MHKVKLPKALLAPLRQKRRRREFFKVFDSARTALLVIDMQNHWVHKSGFSHIRLARGIVPNINRLTAALRRAGGTVIWVISSLSEKGRGAWPLLFQNLEDAPEGAMERAELIPGHPMHALWAELVTANVDLWVTKDRFSAFAPGASDLWARLRERAIDSLWIAGVATNICCETTARDAMMLDFRTVMIEDANAARTDADHLAGLRTFVQVFGEVLTTRTAITRLCTPETHHASDE